MKFNCAGLLHISCYTYHLFIFEMTCKYGKKCSCNPALHYFGFVYSCVEVESVISFQEGSEREEEECCCCCEQQASEQSR